MHYTDNKIYEIWKDDTENNKFKFSPAKSVGHDAHTEGAHHAAHTKDGDSDAPDDGADSRSDGYAITLHPGIVEERS